MRQARAVGVIGAGAMGLGMVESLLRGGFAVHVRDILPQAERDAVRLGARGERSPAAVVRACDVTLVVVVDSAQVEDVLFGADGAATALTPDGLVLVASTIAPGDLAAFAARLTRGELLGTPVSGGPARAHDGTMTMMVAGSAAALDRCAPVFAAIAGKVFRVGSAPADAARFKIINNLLAAVNLAAGAEAMALAAKAGLDPRQVYEVIDASSGASWILRDRMPRALAGELAPRAATRVLCKDVGLAVDLAAQEGVDAPFARAAHAAFSAAVAAGFAEHDDAAMYEWARRAAGL